MDREQQSQSPNHSPMQGIQPDQEEGSQDQDLLHLKQSDLVRKVIPSYQLIKTYRVVMHDEATVRGVMVEMQDLLSEGFAKAELGIDTDQDETCIIAEKVDEIVDLKELAAYIKDR